MSLVDVHFNLLYSIKGASAIHTVWWEIAVAANGSQIYKFAFVQGLFLPHVAQKRKKESGRRKFEMYLINSIL